MADTRDIQFMRQALRLARKGQGKVEPNPMVGCVIARNGVILAEGWHQCYGGPHAEVQALADAHAKSIDPAGCDVFVSLEPCCHFGKTPPCTDALIQAQPRRVVAALVDPFPAVAGQGLEKLRQAGIIVEVGVGAEAARQLNESFFKRVATGLPWVIAKWAQTVDGRIATRAGDSRWISNEKSRRLAHQLRGRVDAIVVGIGTVRADDPQLTARGVSIKRKARRVVVDPHLRLPLETQLVRSLADQNAPPLTVAVAESTLRNRPEKLTQLENLGVEFIGLPALENDRLALQPLLQHLAEKHQAANVLVEGGARLLGTFLKECLVDQLLVFVGPQLLADQQALGAAVGWSVEKIDQALALSLRSVQRLEDDVLLDYRFSRPVC